MLMLECLVPRDIAGIACNYRHYSLFASPRFHSHRRADDEPFIPASCLALLCRVLRVPGERQHAPGQNIS
jgi:hypothetical protein